MNKIAKKLFSAAVIVCLSISSVAAYAAQITPSSTSINASVKTIKKFRLIFFRS